MEQKQVNSFVKYLVFINNFYCPRLGGSLEYKRFAQA